MYMTQRPQIVVLRGVVLATLFVILWFWLASFVRRFDSMIGVFPPAWLQPMGWILAVAGGALGGSCVVLFLKQGRGTPAPFDPPKVFVASGPYRYVRNPMYIGGIMALFGGGLIVRSPSIIALGAIFWLLSHCMVLLVEEPDLAKRFGESFTTYKNQVNRWVPRVPRSL
jgi:protein-S-isoprenylcysteine O-methyltransferase Ste14